MQTTEGVISLFVSYFAIEKENFTRGFLKLLPMWMKRKMEEVGLIYDIFVFEWGIRMRDVEGVGYSLKIPSAFHQYSRMRGTFGR